MTTAIPLAPPKRLIELTVDGATVRVPEGTTLLQACRAQGIDTPTLCYLENLTPVNVCRVCVVEVEGSRTLVPACSRTAEPGMVVHTDSDRVKLSRKVVLEFLGSSVDLSLAGPTAPNSDIAVRTAPTRLGTGPRPHRTGRANATPPSRGTITTQTRQPPRRFPNR
jgi:predicted molibdopterin-dependent oxidoreductase YjgC